MKGHSLMALGVGAEGGALTADPRKRAIGPSLASQPPFPQMRTMLAPRGRQILLLLEHCPLYPMQIGRETATYRNVALLPAARLHIYPGSVVYGVPEGG